MYTFTYRGYEITQNGNIYGIKSSNGEMWETKELIEIIKSIDGQWSKVFN
jgi:hypothetical protein